MKFLERSQSSRARLNHNSEFGQPPAIPANRSGPLTAFYETVERRKSIAMLRRPNTSAGVDERRDRSLSRSRTTTARVIAKEPTCGEHLQHSARMLEYTDGLDTFRFPTPEPRTASPSPRMPPRSATFQHSPSLLQYESPSIGIAIGSPSNAPPNWGRSFTADNISVMSRSQPPSRVPPPPPVQVKEETGFNSENRRKKNSWKTFGGLFRKSSKQVSQEPFYKCKLPPESGRPAPEPRTPRFLGRFSLETTSPTSRSPNSFSTRQHLGTPPWQRSRAETPEQVCGTPSVPSPGSSMMRSTTASPRYGNPPGPIKICKSPLMKRHDSPLEDESAQELLSLPRTPRLNLEIPKPEFERYSIMFEKLLSNDSKPSLLERRQSRLQKTRSGRFLNLGGSSEKPEIRNPVSSIPQRSLTSPHLTHALSITLESRNSAETPTAMLPLTTTSAQQSQLSRSNTVPINTMSPLSSAFFRTREESKFTQSTSPESPTSLFHSENSLPPTPTTIATCPDIDTDDQNEPAWEMLTKPTSTAAHAKMESRPLASSPADPEGHTAQVSVARQVSLSRTKSRVKRTVETKQPLRPRVVELSRNRKSTVGVLESVDGDQEPDSMPKVSFEESIAPKKSCEEDVALTKENTSVRS